MISTVIIWAYVLFLTTVYGIAAIRILKRLFKLEDSVLPLILVALTGLVVLTTIIGYLSILAAIGLRANALLLSVAIILALIERNELGRVVSNCLEEIRQLDRYLIVLFLFVAVAMLMQTTITARIYDTGTYAQSIKWIEEYRQIPGLANLDPKLGFNSSWLWINALFSFSFLRTEPFHLLNGWFLLLIITYTLGRLRKLAAADFQFGSIMGAAILVIGLPFFWSSLSSPYLDMPVTLTLWIMFILFTDEMTDNTPDFNLRTVLMFVLSCFIVTLKLSAAPILIFLLYFLGVAFLKNRKNVLVIAGMVAFVVAPWFIRNIIETGYLIYPFPSLDIFNFDWQVPSGTVLDEVRWIASWARIPVLTPDQVLSMPWYVWMPIWFQRLPIYFKLLSIGIAGFSFIDAARLVMNFKRLGRISSHWGSVILWTTPLVSMVFWFVTAPDFRFGLGFMVPFVVLSAAPLIHLIGPILEKRIRFLLIAGLVAELAVLYHTIDFATLSQRAIFPAQYPSAETRILVLNNVQVNVPVVNDQCWLAPLPCTPSPNPKLELRDGTLDSGFRISDP